MRSQNKNLWICFFSVYFFAFLRTECYLNACFLNLFKEIPDVPTVDLAFALSATANDADTNFKLMKDTIKSFADMYGVSKINYAVITYGERQRKWVDFQNQPSDFEDMKKTVDDIARETGVVALDKALEEARKLFDGARPQARKVIKCFIGGEVT